MTFIFFLPNYKFVLVSCKISWFLNFHVSHLNQETFKLCLQNILNMSKTTRVYFGVLHMFCSNIIHDKNKTKQSLIWLSSRMRSHMRVRGLHRTVHERGVPRRGEQSPIENDSYKGYSPSKCTCNGITTNTHPSQMSHECHMSCMKCHHAHIPSHSPTPSHMYMPNVKTVTGITNDPCIEPSPAPLPNASANGQPIPSQSRLLSHIPKSM